jgi:hypothetical protein
MESQPAREQLIAELKRQGLPLAYIQRLLEELDDHFTDLQDERNRAMNPSDVNAAATTRCNQPVDQSNILNLQQRLGDPTQLAAFAAKQYRNRSFLGRHPIFTFLFMPLPLIVSIMAGISVAMIPLDYIYNWMMSGANELDHPVLLGMSISLVFWTLIVLPPLGAVGFLCRIARRNTVKWKWTFLAAILVSVYCAQVFIHWSHAPVAPTDKGIAIVGWGFYPSSISDLATHFIPQFASAMGICLLLIRRAQRLQKLDEVRDESSILRRAA